MYVNVSCKLLHKYEFLHRFCRYFLAFPILHTYWIWANSGEMEEEVCGMCLEGSCEGRHREINLRGCPEPLSLEQRAPWLLTTQFSPLNFQWSAVSKHECFKQLINLPGARALNKPRSVVTVGTGSPLWKQFLAVPAFALLAANTHAPAASVRLRFQ